MAMHPSCREVYIFIKPSLKQNGWIMVPFQELCKRRC